VTIAVFAALRWECTPIVRSLRQVRRERRGPFTLWRGDGSGAEVIVVKTGVGVERAATAARLVCDTRRFDVLLSTGCAGALLPSLVPGDLVVGTAVVANPSGERFETNPAWRARVLGDIEQAHLPITVGPMLCSREVLPTAAAKQAAAAQGFIAVEMEGAAIGAHAAAAGVPFVAVRAILDRADAELPHAGKFVDASGAIKPLALARELVTHPGIVPDLLAMQRLMQAAQTGLGRFFGAFLSQ
jgi:nucleoside phosphorylase